MGAGFLGGLLAGLGEATLQVGLEFFGALVFGNGGEHPRERRLAVAAERHFSAGGLALLGIGACMRC